MRHVVHLDADAFFASVEQAADPRLRGKPVAVGGEKRGIIASASYEARRFGIYTPMPTARARKLCPKLILLPGDFEKYERFSRWMFSYAYDFTPDVEIGSIDEGYFDLSGVRQPPVEIARTIRDAIRQALKITVSEGLGTNKLVSQIASKLHKPAAFFHVPAGQEVSFLHPLPNQWLPGIGPQTAERLNTAGLVYVRQIAVTPTECLALLVGRWAPQLKNFANGVDERPVVPASEPAKSYSQQETFAVDQTDEEFLAATLRHMADLLMAKVRADGKTIRTLTVKIRYNDMDERQCSESLAEPTDLETDIYARLPPLLRRAWERRVSLRLVSLKLSNLYDGFFRAELPLEENARQQEARRRLAATIDDLRKTHGAQVILRGHDLTLRDAAESRSRTGFQPVPRATPPPAVWQSTGASCSSSSLVRESKAATAEDEGRGQGRTLLTHPSSAISLVPLAVRSYYSFLNSTLSIQAIVELAQRYEFPALALCDQGNLHGAVEFVEHAKAAGLKPILGAEICVHGQPLRLYVENATGYANLCRLLSNKAGEERQKAEGRRQKAETKSERAERADFNSAFRLLPSALGNTVGLLAIATDTSLAPLFPGRFYLALSSPEDGRRHAAARFPGVASLPVHYATAADRWKYDIVQSIRTLTLRQQKHPEKNDAGDFHFHTPAETRELFREHPDWLGRSREIADRCTFEFPLGPPQFPAFVPPDGSAPREFLRQLVMAGARGRYSGVQLSTLNSQLSTELSIIAEVGYEEYFLVVWDILQECRRRGIEWITRGSAADSLVCYCLGISEVCPVRFGLYFRRFLNKERMALNKLPDIDVDFAHDRKDDVIDLIFEKYGTERCAVVGGFSTFQARSAFAEVAKVLGVAEREVRRFTEHFPWSFGGGAPFFANQPDGHVAEASDTAFPLTPALSLRERETAPPSSGDPTRFAMANPWSQRPPLPKGEGWGEGKEDARENRLAKTLRARPDCRDLPLEEEPYRTALAMAAFLDGFPRYPKMHPCGVVLSRQPMHELTPTFISNKGYPTTHFDMDAVEAIGLVKMDILAQGGLAVMRDVQATLAARGLEVDLGKAEVKRQKAEGRRQKAETESERADSNSAFGLQPSALPWNDPAVWDMIADGHTRAVHHIESPAMISLCRMCNVHDIDTLIAIVSVIRPGAANEDRKREFTRRYQGLSPITYPHPSLEPCLQDSFGLLIYEEQLLQVCEAFAGLPPGRADVLRRALGKEKLAVVTEIAKEFVACARTRGRTDTEIAHVWKMISGFQGYTFCKAHSTAYGIEAYQSAWLKRYFPAEFMAAVLSHGKGFYRPLVYVLECHRLGIPLLPPWVNEPGPAFTVKAEQTAASSSCPSRDASPFCLLPSAFPKALRVPATYLKGLSETTKASILAERQRGEFASLRDFYLRVAPAAEDMELLIRAGAFDGFGQSRTAQFWDSRFLCHAFGHTAEPGQGWLWEKAEGRRQKAETKSERAERADSNSSFCLHPSAFLTEPSRRQQLEWEYELFGFPASGHPLELYDDIAWETYCPVSRLGEFVGDEVVTCGLVIEDRVHHQVTGEPMKFLTLADWTGMIETELFAQTYKSYGLATVRYPVLEVTARVEPFENGRGFTLRVLRAGKPRTRKPKRE